MRGRCSLAATVAFGYGTSSTGSSLRGGKDRPYAGRSLSAGDGANYVQSPEQVHPFEQGFLLKVRKPGSTEEYRPLDKTGWKDLFSRRVSHRVRLVSRSCLRRGCGLGILSPYVPLESEEAGLPSWFNDTRFVTEAVSRLKWRFRDGSRTRSESTPLSTAKVSFRTPSRPRAGLMRCRARFTSRPTQLQNAPASCSKISRNPPMKGGQWWGRPSDPVPLRKRRCPPTREMLEDPEARRLLVQCAERRNG